MHIETSTKSSPTPTLDIGHFFDLNCLVVMRFRYSKPYPHMLEKVLYETKIDREDAIFIGDGTRETLRHQRGQISTILWFIGVFQIIEMKRQLAL